MFYGVYTLGNTLIEHAFIKGKGLCQSVRI